MLYLRTWRSIVVAAAVLAVVAAALPEALADVIQPAPSLPPTAGSYTPGTICVPLGPGVCVVGASLGNFTGTTLIFGSGGQAIDSTVTLSANVYTDSGGSPGTFLAHLVLEGGIGILYAGRTSDTELGTFTSTLTELDLTGTFHGPTTHTIAVMLNPLMTSSGQTTVAPSGSDFRIHSFFDVFVELSLDGGPFVAGPPRTVTLVSPEPGSASMLALGLIGVAAELRRRVRSAIQR